MNMRKCLNHLTFETKSSFKYIHEYILIVEIIQCNEFIIKNIPSNNKHLLIFYSIYSFGTNNNLTQFALICNNITKQKQYIYFNYPVYRF